MDDSKDHPMGDFTGEFSQFYGSDEDEFDFEELNPNFAEVNSTAPRYSDFEEIGRGGMKRISRVYDHASGRYVAMAQLHADAPAALYEAFLCEARLTACLQHPNIIPIYDVGILNGGPFFTMELKSGQSVAGLLAAKGLKRERALEIFVKVCDAISYAHSRSVIHLDLKPANIQVGEYGGVMVCDWGLGKILGEPDGEHRTQRLNPDMLNDITLTGQIKGTPGFMAPEQIDSGGIKNQQTDVFALGALLYSLLMLRHPAEDNIDATLDKTRAGQLFNFDVSASKVPKSLRAVVAKTTAVKPDQRYRSVADLRDEVHQYLSGYPTLAEHAGFAKQLVLLLKRNRRISIFLLIVSFFTLGVTVYSFQEVRKSGAIARRERDVARESLEKYTKEKRYSTEMVNSYEQSVLWLTYSFQASGLYFSETRTIDYLNVIGELDNLLKKNPKHLAAITEKSRLLVIMQRFAAAAECIAISSEEREEYRDLVKLYGEKYPGGELKDAEVVAAFIRRLNEFWGKGRAPFCEMMMAYDAMVRPDLSGHSLVVREVVHIYNPKWTNQLFNYDAAERSLLIGGRHLNMLISDRFRASQSNLLRTLNLHTLTIQCPEFVDLNEVAKLRLHKLDIRETGVNSVPEPNALMQISEIICRKGQFSPEEMNTFPPHLHVVEK